MSEWRKRRKTSPKHIGHANTGDIIMMLVFFSWNQGLSQGGGNYERLQTPVNSGEEQAYVGKLRMRRKFTSQHDNDPTHLHPIQQ